MKIVMLCEFFNEELEFQENLLAKFYPKNGHDVTIICSTYESVFDYYEDKPAPKEGSEYIFHGAKIIKLPFRYNILNRFRPLQPISDILEREKPDLLYIHDIMPNIPECVSYVRRHPNTRMIMDYHADYSNSGKNWISIKILHGILRKRHLDMARPYLEKIFPIVPAGFEFLQEVYGVPMEEMELLPLGTDLEFGRAVHRAGGGKVVRDRLNIPAGDFVIFTGGKLTPNRRTEHLIDAFRSLDRVDAHLIIVGTSSDEYADYRKLLADRAGESGRIHFAGWLDKQAMYEHLDAADIGIFPGGQSVIWQQAIGMGLPMIVVDRSEQIRGHQDASYLNRHDNLVILDPARPTAGQIERLLRELIDDRARLAHMSEGAHRTAAEILDWNVLIQKTLRSVQERGDGDRVAGRS